MSDTGLAAVDLDTERAVIGAMLLEGEEAFHRAPDVTPAVFYLESHRAILRAMVRLRDHGVAVDLVTVSAELQRAGELEVAGGPAALALLVDHAAIAPNLPAYVGIICEQAQKREWMALGHRLANANGAGPAELAEMVREAQGLVQAVTPARPATYHAIGVIDAADLMMREFLDEPALVGGGLIVQRALVVNGGPAKKGKSMLVLNREIRRALGLTFLGFKTPPGRSLYIQAEIPEPQLKERLGLMLDDCPDHGAIDAERLRGRLLTVTRRGLFIDEPAGYDSVRRLIEQTEPDLLSLDPLARFMTGEENSARDVGRLINSLDRLIQEYWIAVELTHHAGKPAPNDPRQGGQRLRGSSALFGAADSVTMLDRTQDGWTLTFELRHAEEPAPMSLERTENLWFKLGGPPEKLVAVGLLVKDMPMRYSTLTGAIVADTKVSTPTAERLVRDAKKAGIIWQGADGLYRRTITRHHGDSDGEGSTE